MAEGVTGLVGGATIRPSAGRSVGYAACLNVSENVGLGLIINGEVARGATGADPLRYFHAALRGGAPDEQMDDVIHPDDGLRAQQVMDAIYESDRTGQRVILNG